MEDSLTNGIARAEHSLGFAWEELRDALRKANSVEAIVLLDLIRQVAETRNKVKELLNAHLMDK